nr:MAG TPA: hypothetical protein [Caudoviricetes sp.]
MPTDFARDRRSGKNTLDYPACRADTDGGLCDGAAIR